MIITRLTPTPKGDKNSLYEAVKTQQKSDFTIDNLTTCFTKIDVSIKYGASGYVVTVTGYNSGKSTTTFIEKLRTKVISRLTTLLLHCGLKEQKENLDIGVLGTIDFSEVKLQITETKLLDIVNRIIINNGILDSFSIEALSNYIDANEVSPGKLDYIKIDKTGQTIEFTYSKGHFTRGSDKIIKIDTTKITSNKKIYFNGDDNIKIISKEHIKRQRTNQDSKTIYIVETENCSSEPIINKLKELGEYTEVWCTWDYKLSEIQNEQYIFTVTKTELPTD